MLYHLWRFHPLRRMCGWALILVVSTACGADFTVLENSRVQLEFRSDQGGLVSLRDKSEGLLTEGPGFPLWLIVAPQGAVVGPESAKSFTIHSSNGDPTGLEMVWGGFGLEAAPDLQVKAEVSLPSSSPEVVWRIHLDNLARLQVREVHFPRIGGLRELPGETLAVPEWMGKKSRGVRKAVHSEGKTFRPLVWEYPGILSMQCLAWYYDTGPGLLLSTRDSTVLRKKFAIFGEPQKGLGLEVIHQPSIEEGTPSSFSPAYDTVLRLFQGGWFEAGQLYSEWARNQWWVHESRLRQGMTSPWAADTGLWVWNRGHSDGVLGPAELLKNRIGLPVSVFWHWWHGCAYDAGFPEYLPPREGVESFQRALHAAHENDIHALVYMNQRLWGMTTESWKQEGAENFAVKGPEGKIHPEVYNIFMKTPCASMCMGTSFWREKYAGLATDAHRLGVDGIYMDQACSSLSCYDPRHGHPLGGGSYWMEGFRTLQGMIRARCQERPITLAGEGCGESWLPYLDLMLSLQVSQERYQGQGLWEPIPFFHSVYHDCVLLYGNYSSLTHPPYDSLWPKEFAPAEPLALLDAKFNTQFRMEQARAFVWGQQPCLANFTPRLLEDRAPQIAFLGQLAKVRHAARDFLQDGRMLRPLELETREAEIPLSRLSIYAGQQDKIKESTGLVQLVYSTVWQAADGRVGVALANISEEPQPVSFSLSGKDYPIPSQGTLRLIDFEGTEDLAEYQGGEATLRLELEPCSTCFVEILSAGS